MQGGQSNISQDCPEHLESIDSMCDHLSTIVKKGIQFRLNHEMSGFHISIVFHFQTLALLFDTKRSVCFFIYIFSSENAYQWPLPELWGEETNSLLKKAGLNVSFHSFPDLNHQLCRQELELLRSWTLKKLSL
uniref:Uncharacterized protein n=1 Tax=Cyprinus carpio TaxID=7962 RepID=A0A8C2I102_CYPCA